MTSVSPAMVRILSVGAPSRAMFMWKRSRTATRWPRRAGRRATFYHCKPADEATCSPSVCSDRKEAPTDA